MSIPEHLLHDVQLDELLGIVNAGNGLSLHAIDSKAKHTDTIDATHELLDELVRKKKIIKWHAVYYPAGKDIVPPAPVPPPAETSKPPAEHSAMKVKLKGKNQIKIFNAIPDGGCDIDHLVKTTGMGRDNIQGQIHHLKRKGLVKSRMIKPEKGGHHNAFYTRTKDAVAVRLANEPDHPLKIKTETASGQAADPSSAVAVVKASIDPLPEVGAILQRAVTQAQNNLDDYLASIADPEIMSALRAARDNSRKALADYQARVNA